VSKSFALKNYRDVFYQKHIPKFFTQIRIGRTNIGKIFLALPMIHLSIVVKTIQQFHILCAVSLLLSVVMLKYFMKNANFYSVRTSVPRVYRSLQRNLSGLSKRVEFYFSYILGFILD
jgi:hypothetical protein